MIKKIVGMLLVIFGMVILSASNVRAENTEYKDNTLNDEVISIDDFDLSDGGRILHKNGYNIDSKEIINKIMDGKITEVIKDIFKIIYNKTIGDISLVERTIGNLLLIVILSAFFTNLANAFSMDSVSDTGFYICYLVAITVMVTLFESFCVITADFVKLLLGFIGGILPAYFLSVAVTGQAAATGFYQLTLVVISVSEFAFLKIIIPLIKIYLSISLINNISQEDLLSRTTYVLRNLIKFINKTLIGIVTGLNIIQGLILPSIDVAKNTTIRKVVGALPVIGDGTDAMTGILFGSVNLIKNTIGTFGIIVIIVICMVPFLKIQLYSASMQIATALVQPVADKRILSSMECLCGGTKLLSQVIISNGLLFIVSLAIVCMTTNIR